MPTALTKVTISVHHCCSCPIWIWAWGNFNRNSLGPDGRGVLPAPTKCATLPICLSRRLDLHVWVSVFQKELLSPRISNLIQQTLPRATSPCVPVASVRPLLRRYRAHMRRLRPAGSLYLAQQVMI